MTQPAFTSGPWAFDGPSHNIIVWGPDPEHRVCFMTSNGPALENAQLIAAAPDLYEALTEARDLIHAGYCDDEARSDAPELSDAEIDEGAAPIHCEECRNASAALAKARGEA
jgi:hypothetical protein